MNIGNFTLKPTANVHIYQISFFNNDNELQTIYIDLLDLIKQEVSNQLILRNSFCETFIIDHQQYQLHNHSDLKAAINSYIPTHNAYYFTNFTLNDVFEKLKQWYF
jgi:hypothetical protein